MTDLYTLGKAMRDAQQCYYLDATQAAYERLVATQAAFDKALAAHGEFTDAYGKHAGTPEAVYQEGYLDGLAAAKEEAADALAAAQARIAALEDALTLAANRLDRLALELPFESRALSDCVEWCEEARAALAKGGEND